jgi:hypothetical protein
MFSAGVTFMALEPYWKRSFAACCPGEGWDRFESNPGQEPGKSVKATSAGRAVNSDRFCTPVN